jgi:hypothetical protein
MVFDQLPARAQNEQRKIHCRATSSIELLWRQGGLQIASTKGLGVQVKSTASRAQRAGFERSAYLDAVVVSPQEGAATGLRAPPQACCPPTEHRTDDPDRLVR